MTAPIPSDLLADLRRTHGEVRLYGRDSSRYVLVTDLIDEIGSLKRVIEHEALDPKDIDERWVIPLHKAGCPYDELKAWRAEHGLEGPDSEPCICTVEEKCQAWCVRAFLLAGAIRMQSRQLSELKGVTP
jgi:hypothetical protein